MYATEAAGRSADAALREWGAEYPEPLARRWGHVAPLLMQAMLALGAGRKASASVPETLEELAEREEAAAAAFPVDPSAGRLSPRELGP